MSNSGKKGFANRKPVASYEKQYGRTSKKIFSAICHHSGLLRIKKCQAAEAAGNRENKRKCQ